MYGLEINGLLVDYGNFSLDVTCKIKKGCITGLVGRNGAGKSSLIRTIMRQQDADAGYILYNGKKFCEDEKGVLNSIACVFDAPHFYTYAKAKKVVKLYSKIYKNFDKEYCASLMKRFGLAEDMRISKYSLGMQRKFCLALALSQRPDILILDEPTSGVDPVDREEIISLIQEFMLDENKTVLFSTHITEDLDKVADYIVMLDGGKVIVDSEKDSLTEKYRLVTTQTFTEEMKKNALGVKRGAFGYTFLTTDTSLSGAGIQSKMPAVEEIFIHLLGGKE